MRKYDTSSKISQNMNKIVWFKKKSTNSSFRETAPLLLGIAWTHHLKKLKNLGLNCKQTMLSNLISATGMNSWWKYFFSKTSKIFEW